jgi:hypothetical protein
MSHTTHLTTSHASAGGGDAGLPLIDLTATGDGVPNGAWFPRSSDLVAELPELLADLDAQDLQVRRVSYHPATWRVAPRRMVSDARWVDLSPSSALHPHLLCLFLVGSHQPISLLVILPADAP